MPNCTRPNIQAETACVIDMISEDETIVGIAENASEKFDDDNRIQLLSDHVVNQIAAGEVIERPASVVKELLENSIDAGANFVSLDMQKGGKSWIRVSDNGSGMSKQDAERALLRHATSKLRNAEDLFSLQSLGFRGEALSSIAAVSKTILTTRRKTDTVGTRILCEGGNITARQEVGCAFGTTIDVRDLFFNTPARKEFLRSQNTEQLHMIQAATQVLLGARKGGLMARSEKRVLLNIPEDFDEETKVKTILGRNVDSVYAFEAHEQGIGVQGYLTRPEAHRKDARGLWFFVNHRFVRDRMIQRAVFDGYRSLLEAGRYPVVVLFLDVDPKTVDVNVHPQKFEVRFGQSDRVFRAVAHSIARALAAAPWMGKSGSHQVPGIVSGATWQQAFSRSTASDTNNEDETVVSTEKWFERGEQQQEIQNPSTEVETGKNHNFAHSFFAKLRPVGQVLKTYLVCEDGEQLVLIDQHAAHERVAFEHMWAQAQQGKIEAQRLLFSEVLDVGEQCVALIQEHRSLFEQLGFDLDQMGPGKIAIRSIPLALGGTDAKKLLRDMLDEMESFGPVGVHTANNDFLARMVSRSACHQSVRSGDVLLMEEAKALLADLQRVDFSGNCPHGRPVFRTFSRQELDTLFHRG